MNSTVESVLPSLVQPLLLNSSNLVIDDSSAHCGRDALTNSYGWFVQVLLASLAFMLLIVKRFCEPLKRRRSWLVWFYDTSKQGLGAGLVHFANVFLAGEFTGDPCTWYIVSFLLDSTVGLMLVWAGIRLSILIGRRYRLPTLIFGEYGRPPSCVFWAHQCLVYCGLMGCEKLVVTALMRLPYWTSVRDMILAPIPNPQARVALVVLVIPFFVNALIFWVTDNFLMVKVRSGGADAAENLSSAPGSRRDQKVMYQRCRSSSLCNDEADILINHAVSCGSSDECCTPSSLPDTDWHSHHTSLSTTAAACYTPPDSDQSSDVAILGVDENLSGSPVPSPLHQHTVVALQTPMRRHLSSVAREDDVLVNIATDGRSGALPVLTMTDKNSYRGAPQGADAGGRAPLPTDAVAHMLETRGGDGSSDVLQFSLSQEDVVPVMFNASRGKVASSRNKKSV